MSSYKIFCLLEILKQQWRKGKRLAIKNVIWSYIIHIFIYLLIYYISLQIMRIMFSVSKFFWQNLILVVQISLEVSSIIWKPSASMHVKVTSHFVCLTICLSVWWQFKFLCVLCSNFQPSSWTKPSKVCVEMLSYLGNAQTMTHIGKFSESPAPTDGWLSYFSYFSPLCTVNCIYIYSRNSSQGINAWTSTLDAKLFFIFWFVGNFLLCSGELCVQK